ncbi:MAG TPA: YfcE family phosphodiesterase [Porphyromonadaceae bacterium]|nr:YfcE family phosphodiesterase [Porphyromonadaceae bacterium]
MSKRIGVLSDTHGFWDEAFERYFSSCDEIWHAGDIGSAEVANRLSFIAPLRAVYGNMDGYEVRYLYPEHLRFNLEGVEVWLTHIGGYPGKYAREVVPTIYNHPPKLFVCGHSHILKVMNDPTLHLLHINPGASGRQGIHQKRTIILFTLDNGEIKDLDVVELGSRSIDGH